VYKAQASFSPAPFAVTTSNQKPLLNEPVLFAASSQLHFRTATLLGRLAEVRFTPERVSWMFGDGSASEGVNVNHAFSRAGSYLVSARVFYEADYRFSGGLVWISGGVISLTDKVLLEIAVAKGAEPPAVVSNRVLLVAKNCLERPAAFGCVP
jgi:hypothetical protein